MATTNKDVIDEKAEYFRNDFFFVKIGNQLKRIEIKDILFIKSLGNRSSVTTSNNTIIVSSPLRQIVARLEFFGFYKCHSNYLVQISNIDFVNSIKNEIVIAEHIIPIEKLLKNQFISMLKKLK